MQRTALGVLAAALLICGCKSPNTTRGLGPPPEPVMATRPAPPLVRAVPRPRKYTPPRYIRPPAVSRDWLPSGGLKPGRWKTLVVHHSATRKGTPQGMHNFHRNQRGWSNGLGYHFVIGNGVDYPDGKVFVGPRWKQQQTGAHCKSASGRYCGSWRPDNYFNEHGIGICLIGNFENQRPTAKQMAALQKLCAFLCRKMGIHASQVYGHGEVTHRTLCPGHRLDMDSVRRDVKFALAQLSHTPALATAKPEDTLTVGQ